MVADDLGTQGARPSTTMVLNEIFLFQHQKGWGMFYIFTLYRPITHVHHQIHHMYQCLPVYIINEVGHLTTSVDHLAEFCQNYHLAAICTQLMVKFFLQLRFIQYFDCKCMKIPDFSRIDSHFVAQILILANNGLHQLITTSHLLWVRGNTVY